MTIIIIIVITPDNNKITAILLRAGDGLILLGIPPITSTSTLLFIVTTRKTL